MTTEINWQERALRAEAMLEKTTARLDETTQRMEYLEAQVRLLTAKRFGASSEKTPDNQLSLFGDAFNEAEATAQPFAPEPDLSTIEVTGHKRKKKRTRDELLEGLPENTIHHQLSEEEMVCSCGHPRHVIRQEVSRELRIVPAQFWVDVHIQDVCGCRHCEQHGDLEQSPIVTAQRPARAIPYGIGSPSSVAYVMEQKYVMGVPLYRQEQQWKRQDIPLSRQTMANWVIHCAEQWLAPVYDLLRLRLLEQDIIMADESSLQVLKEPGRSPQSTSYMWLYRSGRYAESIVLYEYKPSRGQENPKAFLEGFEGFLITDGYAGYNSVQNVTRVGCWSHARRYFDEAVKASGGKGKKPKAKEGSHFCNRLFKLEEQWADLEPDERQAQRNLESKPILEAFSAWLHETQSLCVPKSHLGKAITYCLNQWEPLNNFLLDGRLPIDNNASERSIKPFVMARKNFLFSNTPKGARASAITFSMIETAKENGLKPFEYLEYLFTHLPSATSQELEQYLPWSDTIPAYCKMKLK